MTLRGVYPAYVVQWWRPERCVQYEAASVTQPAIGLHRNVQRRIQNNGIWSLSDCAICFEFIQVMPVWAAVCIYNTKIDDFVCPPNISETVLSS